MKQIWKSNYITCTNESSFITIDEHNCAIETSSLDEKVKNKFHIKLKSKTNKYK